MAEDIADVLDGRPPRHRATWGGARSPEGALSAPTAVGSYVHTDNKKAALVAVEGGDAELAHVVHAGGLLGLGLGFSQCGQQQTGKDGNDGDDHQ